MLAEQVLPLPAAPFRGIDSFRYVDHPIFFAREEETRRLASLVAVYRGVMLYGESGTGKSSLINAGLLPRTSELGFTAERVRVQPRAGEEIVVERIPLEEDGGRLLPSVLAFEDERSQRVVLSIEAFEARVRSACEAHRLLIVFDQFEEILTLFEETGERGVQQRLVEMLLRLLREPLAVKLLFGFREDYLGKVKELLHSAPELVDQSLRLAPPSADALPDIIRGPFERYPGHFTHELTPALADRLREALDERFGSGDVSLSEVETVCLRLWQSPDPELLLSRRGLQGLLEDYLGEALDQLPPDLRTAAIALLSQMVTAAGTRNVISAGDLVQRIRAEDRELPEPLLTTALERLERESRLVRRERRRDLYLYEITSEFIVPWISAQRDELRRQHERRRDRRRLMLLGLVMAALAAFGAVVTIFAIEARDQRARAREQASRAERNTREAQRLATEATSLGLAMAAASQRTESAGASLLLSLAAHQRRERPETRGLLLRALGRARKSGTVGTLHGHKGSVYGVAVSPIGGAIASGGADGTVRLWDPSSNRQRALIGRHRGPVSTVAFSPDGRLLASTDIGQEIRLWDVRNGKSLGVVETRLGTFLSSISFSSDSRQLIAVGDGKLLRWDVGDRGLILRAYVEGPRAWGYSATAFSADARFLAWVTYNGRLGLWDVRRSKPVPGLPVLHRDGLFAVAVSPDGRMIAASGNGKRIELVDVRARRRLRRPLRGRTGQIFNLAFSPDGRSVAATGRDKAITMWDISSHRRLRLTPHAGTVHGLAFRGPDSIVSAGGDSTIAISSVRSARRFGRVIPGFSSYFTASALSPTVAAVAGHSRIALVDLRGREPVRYIRTRGRGDVETLALSRDGRVLAAARHNGTVRVWDVNRRVPLVPALRAHAPPKPTRWPEPVPLALSSFTSVSLSDDGGRLAATGDSGTIRIWNLPAGAPLTPLRTGVRRVVTLALSSDGSTIAVAGADGRIRLWDVADRTQLGRALRSRARSVTSLKFSPYEDLMASAGDDGTIALWDTAALRLIGPLSPHITPSSGVAFGPDGDTVAVATYYGRIELWDLRNRRHLVSLGRRRAAVSSYVEFSTDGRSLFSMDDSGVVRVWDEVLWGSDSELEQRVCRLVGSGLSRSDWLRHAPDITFQETCR